MRRLNTVGQKTLSDILKIYKEVIDSDEYERHAFRDLINGSPKLKSTHADGIKIMDQFNELHYDVFSSLFKYKPEKHTDEEIAITHKINSMIVDDMLESSKYKELRTMTRLDKLMSAVGTEVLGEEVKELMKKHKEELDKLQEELEKAAADAAAQGDGEGEGEEGDGSGGEGDGEETEGEEGDGKGKSNKKFSLEEAQKRLEAAREKLGEYVEKHFKSSINTALGKSLNKVVETTESIQNWGLEKDTAFTHTGYQEKLKLLERLRGNEKLKRIAELAGRYKSMALQAQREKIKHGIQEIYDVHRGDDLTKIVSSEYIKLAHPDLEYLFAKDFADKGLLIYNYEDKIKKHKGPIVALIDSSGSMSGVPEIWAKSTAMGLLEIAKVQKRDFCVVHFSSNDFKNLHINNFKYNESSHIEQIIDMANYFEGGGTYFEPPLAKAQAIIDDDKKEFEKADIIMITDGESAVGDKWVKEFKEWKAKRKVSVYSILIDSSANSATTLKLFSDEIIKCSELSTLTQDTTSLDLFKFI